MNNWPKERSVKRPMKNLEKGGNPEWEVNSSVNKME